MSLSPQEQFKKFLESSKEILVLISENPSTDAVGSAWALYHFLEKLSISPTIAFSNNLSKKFDFLPQPKNILTEISGARDFVLSFNTERNKIMRVRHEEKDNNFNILVTPEKGSVDPRDFSFVLAKFKYDLVVTIGTPDLEKLGKIYLENTDLFFEVPVVNIDSASDNDNFGQINLTDITASSSSEKKKAFGSSSSFTQKPDFHKPTFSGQKLKGSTVVSGSSKSSSSSCGSGKSIKRSRSGSG